MTDVPWGLDGRVEETFYVALIPTVQARDDWLCTTNTSN